MTKVQLLDLSTVGGLFNYRSLYTLGFSYVFGASLWVSFFGGIIAFRSLPRHQFGNLQARTFPIYFATTLGVTGALLGVWTFTHPDVLTHYARPQAQDVAQAYALAIATLFQAGNLFWFGPVSTRVMYRRHRQEKEVGKTYSEPDVSDQMKALNKQFGILHGASSLTNLLGFLALTFHGLWISTHGIKGY